MPIILALGSNIGNRKKNIDEAIEKISLFSNIISKSNLYESEALLKGNAPEEWNKNFYNSAIAITTDLTPFELLHSIKEIEKKMKRDQNSEIWSPRIIDIDIILYDEEIVDTQKLTIPHKEMTNRLFVLYPLNDIIGNTNIPIYNRTIKELLNRQKQARNLKIWEVKNKE